MNIFSLSFGKDSMATLILAAEQGIPIDRVMYCDIRFAPDISGEHPLMAEWIPKAEARLKELFGVTVDHAYSGVSFTEEFFTIKKQGGRIGEIYGFPYTIGAWCNPKLKISVISRYLSQFSGERITQFVGIAYDEPKRWEKMLKKENSRKKYRSLLYEQGLTEIDAFTICERYDLLSPVYGKDDAYRGGCWFCPKQCYSDLYSLWRNYPELYLKLLELEPHSHNTFKPDTSLAALTSRFESGYIPKRRKQRTAQLTLESAERY